MIVNDFESRFQKGNPLDTKSEIGYTTPAFIMTAIDELNMLYKEREAIYNRFSLLSGLPELSFRILYYMRINPETHWLQAQLADRYSLSRKSINSAVSRLANDGYLVLKNIPGNGNRKYMFFTEKGEEFCQKWIDSMIQADDNSFLQLSEEEQKALVILERKTLANFKEAVNKIFLPKDKI